MEHLIQEFGAWLKQGFGWLVDVIVFGCLWGIGQISRLLSTQLGGAPILKIAVLWPPVCVRAIACSLQDECHPTGRRTFFCWVAYALWLRSLYRGSFVAQFALE
jgi:hypothetical protein